MSAPLSPVEGIKTASRGLRGTLVQSLADGATGAIAEDDTQLIKFHGSYQQDDRDLREERRQQKLEPLYSFMLRTRLPAGVATPAQWLALDALARTHGDGGLRITTRQAFQLHGVIKAALRPTLRSLFDVGIDTRAACGDVNRNVIASPSPHLDALHAQVHAAAVKLSEHFLPQTNAYQEIWLDGEPLGDGEVEHEPIYGRTYLPRKFKMAVVVPPTNDVDVFAHDLGFIAIADAGQLIGFNLTVGGGMGASHGDPATYPRLADVLGYFPAEQLLAFAEAVVTTQRDFGDRTLRKHSRLKYLVAERGVDWFRGEVERRAGFALQPAREVQFSHTGDRFGWFEADGDRWHLGLRIPAGRIRDSADRPWLTGLAEIARVHTGEFRLTPNQNLLLSNVSASTRARIEALVQQYRLDLWRTQTPLALDALACVALPTCSLAMAEAERYLPELTDQVQRRLDAVGLSRYPLKLRITGCPNGCARPYLAEIALVGKAPGRYALYLGGNAAGSRLNQLYRENEDEAGVLGVVEDLFGRWAAERAIDEDFGDFLWRSGVLAGAPILVQETGS